jgi:hypothetical protein
MSRGYQNATIAVLLRDNLSLPAVAQRFLSTVAGFPAFAPEVWGNVEPIRTPFQGIEQTLEAWDDPFLWKNKQWRLEGSAWSGRGSQHSAIYLRGSPRHFDFEKALSFLTTCAEVLRADFGYIHLTTETELHGGAVPYKVAYPMDVGLTSHDLRKGIPNLAWITLFGVPYQPLLSQSVRSDECELIQLNSGSSLLRIKTSPQTIVHEFARFNRLREEVKSEIGPDLLGQGFEQCESRARVRFRLPMTMTLRGDINETIRNFPKTRSRRGTD